MITIDMPLAPLPAPRPRVTVRRMGGKPVGMAYYPASYKNAKAAMETWLSLQKGLVPMQGPLHVDTVLYVKRPPTTKKLWPKGDNDNYEKGVWDGLNGHAWVDDEQIVLNTTIKLFTKRDARIVVTVRPYTLLPIDELTVLSLPDLHLYEE